jgi:hypothetical protein
MTTKPVVMRSGRPIVHGPSFPTEEASPRAQSGISDGMAPEKVTRSWLPRAGAFALAATSTLVSVCIAAVAGSRNGDSTTDGVLWGILSVITVLGGHWLPTISRGMTGWLRVHAIVMWVLCTAFATYGHATYFLLSKQVAGDRRANAVSLDALATQTPRPISAILAEEGALRSQLTRTHSSSCTGCSRTHARIAELNTRIAALQAEADEVRSVHDSLRRVDQLRDQQRVDPVTSRLAAWLGIEPSGIDLASALVFAVILDGLASLCWLLATQRRDPPGKEEPQVTVTPVTPVTAAMAVTPPGVVSSWPAISLATPSKVRALSAKPPPARDFDDLVTSAKEAIMTGQIKTTVTGIREHLRCGQVLARAVRKALSEPAANA